ncbi:ABC transporter permease [Streptomyces sp. LRE541]|uniref:ABC transporter permease subunit n=1 Tax=Streptomyces sp. LRE541 TaxID=2931983 RepID=UPI00200CE5AF|nr:ABC transporter permease subunit [Streptomyces sp. LRE541]UPZ32971.1 ABC transporter permease [Streptomyces sp. LRE541]
MSPAMSGAVLRSEWTKARTVRSTPWLLLATFVVTVGSNVAFALAVRGSFDRMPPQEQRNFDPVYSGFTGLGFGQIILLAFGVLLVTGEYTSGTIRASLAAVPQRGVFYLAKWLSGTLAAFAVSAVTVFPSFFLAQSALGPHGTTITDDGVLRATVGGCLYMTLVCSFAMGAAAILRSSVSSLIIMIPLFFFISPMLNNVSALQPVAQFLPDQAGTRMIEVVPDGESVLGPGTGLLVLLAWNAATLLGGYLVLRQRDA